MLHWLIEMHLHEIIILIKPSPWQMLFTNSMVNRLTWNYYHLRLISGWTFLGYQNSRLSQNNITTKLELWENFDFLEGKKSKVNYTSLIQKYRAQNTTLEGVKGGSYWLPPNPIVRRVKSEDWRQEVKAPDNPIIGWIGSIGS